MELTSDQIQKHLEILEDSLHRISVLTGGLDESELRWTPQSMAWSAIEILAHLRSCADIWTYSIFAMLVEDNPSLAQMDERKWAKTAGYSKHPFVDSFQAYKLQRAVLLMVLRDLPVGSWSRSAQIEGRKHTVFSQTRRMAMHEVEHCVQLEELILPIHPIK
jgi:DinB superfamily